ncbi:acyl carrier protein [Asticcacaulis sp. AC466]|uniref:acyl carrier protein n=1 Tax=Asticcacaulis sp. AC466 TaxID=1282362 RepID=UPI00041AA437|nr:acyl carrier protein [Asticcacaulis sp. AC466]
MTPIQSPEDVLYEVVAKEMNMPEATVRQAQSLEELNIDSLEMIEIVMTLEDRLGITIDDRQLREVRSLPQLLALIETSPKKAG